MNARLFADLAERAILTFIQAFIAALLVTVEPIDMFELNTVKAAAVAGVAAALSVIKSGIATLVGDRNSASLIQ